MNRDKRILHLYLLRAKNQLLLYVFKTKISFPFEQAGSLRQREFGTMDEIANPDSPVTVIR